MTVATPFNPDREAEGAVITVLFDRGCLPFLLAASVPVMACGPKGSNDSAASESSGTGGEEEVPCELRTSQHDCMESKPIDPSQGLDPLMCEWVTELLVFTTEQLCSDGLEIEACLTKPAGTTPGCDPTACATISVLFREIDGGVQILPGDYCGDNPEGFSNCRWDMTGELVTGPQQCACACD